MQQTLIKPSVSTLTETITSGATQERAERIANYFESNGIVTEIIPQTKDGFAWFSIHTSTEQIVAARDLYESVRTKRVKIGRVTRITPAPWDKR